MGAPAALRDDATLVSHAVTELARRTHFPVAFGGLEHDGAVHVSTIVGARTRSIEGLVVHAERGLGGRALVERRPRLALDYRNARTITHDYDRAILGEGIATLFAVPVLVRGSARGVLYCGSWAQAPLGEREARPAFDIAASSARSCASATRSIADSPPRRRRRRPERRRAGGDPTELRPAPQHRRHGPRRRRASTAGGTRVTSRRALRRRVGRPGGSRHPPVPPRARRAVLRCGGCHQRRDRGIPRPPRNHREVVSRVGDVQAGCLDPACRRRPSAPGRLLP